MQTKRIDSPRSSHCSRVRSSPAARRMRTSWAATPTAPPTRNDVNAQTSSTTSGTTPPNDQGLRSPGA